MKISKCTDKPKPDPKSDEHFEVKALYRGGSGAYYYCCRGRPPSKDKFMMDLTTGLLYPVPTGGSWHAYHRLPKDTCLKLESTQ